MIIHIDNDVVGHNVLDAQRGVTDLCHEAMKESVGIGVDRKFSLLPFFDAANVRFAHIRVDLHLGQILGNDK